MRAGSSDPPLDSGPECVPGPGDVSGAVRKRPSATRRARSPFVDHYRVLTKTFGFAEYRGEQKAIVEAAISGSDVLCVAPTGMGKSLCFQIPALADKHGVSIVASPLLALMKNQVKKLRELEVAVESWTSETPQEVKQDIKKDLSSGHPRTRLLYITPEGMNSEPFKSILKKLYKQGELNRFIVDEAHCIVEWGHDFRDEYLKLGSFRAQFPDVPIMALTASATPDVCDEIVRNLRMEDKHLLKVVHPFNRPNLFYQVHYVANPAPAEQMKHVEDYITSLHKKRGCPSSGIIYCRARATCDELAEHLRRKGINARPYHKGLSSATLDRTLHEWERTVDGRGGVDVVVCTVAFGMGIDKPDVRYVLHFDMPKSFEGYYQETGRAGRDGKASKCILYYSREDAVRIISLVKKSQQSRVPKVSLNAGPGPKHSSASSLKALMRFVEGTSECRHVSICRYFGEQVNDGDPETKTRYCDKMCDVCRHPNKTVEKKAKFSSDAHISTQAMRLQDDALKDDVHGNVPRVVPSRTSSDEGLGSSGRGTSMKTQAYIQPPRVVQKRHYPSAHIVDVPKRPVDDNVDALDIPPFKRMRTTAASSSSGALAGLSNSLSARKAFKPLLLAPARQAPLSHAYGYEEPEQIEADTDEDDFDKRLNAHGRRSPQPQILQSLDNEPDIAQRRDARKHVAKTGRVSRTSSGNSLGNVSRTTSISSVRETTPELNDDEMMVDLDVEYAFSKKVSIDERRKFVRDVFSALQRAAQTDGSAAQTALARSEDKAQSMEKAAKGVEIDVLSLCASSTGYAQGCKRVRRGLELLGLPQSCWEERDEDAHEAAKSVLDELERACRV